MTEAVRDRVLNAARELGYQVDPIISAGMSQMRRPPEKRIDSALAWLDDTPSRDSLEQNPVFRLVWEGSFAQATDMGYNLERFWLNDPTVSPTRLARILRARGIEGVVVLQYYQEADTHTAPFVNFDFGGFACVSVTTRLSGLAMPFAQADHFTCAELALERLRSLGYRRIGLVCPPSIDALTQRRIYSSYEGFVRHNSEMERVPVFIDESKNEQLALVEWLKTWQPDAVLGWKPPREFQKLGFQVPDQLGVCMLDHLPEFGDCAGIHQNHTEIGAAAIRLLHAQLQQGLRGVPKIATATMIEGHWVPGASVRKVSARKNNRAARKASL